MAAGTTGTGLDRAVDIILDDYGLTNRLPGADLREGAAAADGMNRLIVSAILAKGVANDGAISTSDVYTLNGYLRGSSLASWTALHGDDEGSWETGFHRVQSDGAVTRIFGESAVDTVLDGIYHLAFEIRDGRLVNEDGNSNAAVDDVAFWLNQFLAPELAAGTLANDRVDPRFHGTTGTGLDAIIEAIVADPGLNDSLSRREINQGAAAADGMNALIVEGIRATGIADDGDLTPIDLADLNHWVATVHGAEWALLHGDDEGRVETGFHLVQGDGGRSFLFGDAAVNTVADGLYHLGFDIQWDRFVNEDGNANARVAKVAEWLSVLLRNDLGDGSLDSGRPEVDPTTLEEDIVYRKAAVTDDGESGAVDVGRVPAMRLPNGTIAFTFTCNSPDDGGYHVLFSKDGSSNAAGDVTAFIHDGQLTVLLQDGANSHWLDVGDCTVEAGKRYDFAMSFGAGGLQIYLNGEKLVADYGQHIGLADNTRALVIGGGGWGRDASHPDVIWHHLDGTVADFTAYDRELTRDEVEACSGAGPLPEVAAGEPVRDGAQPAVLAGTGLLGEVFDRSGSFSSIDDLMAQTVTGSADHRFTASHIDFGGHGESGTLGEFLDDAGALIDGGGSRPMTTIGIHLEGYIWLSAGTHLVSVFSDDGFLLSLGGRVISSHAWDRGFDSSAQQITGAGGLYAIDLYYYQNGGADGLRLDIDGRTVGADAFFATAADYDAALAAHGAMPLGGLEHPYDGPEGTTGTSLDALVRIIGTDEGLAHRVSHTQLVDGAAAADAINHLIVDAIEATGAWEDGHLTVSEVYDLSDHIRTHHDTEFIAAHGDDENGVETGFHLLQGDGGTSYLCGEDAINTVLDGIYHIGFETLWGAFANEDGNPNVRVETVTFWLNELLGAATSGNPGTGPGEGAGSAAEPHVVASEALNTWLAAGALTLTLTGSARNGKGNALANTLTGNACANTLDGADADDVLIGNGGNDALIGGRGADELRGGTGDDSYYVDEAGDRIVESEGRAGGTDGVFVGAGVGRYTLAGGLENLALLGNADFIAAGNAAGNRLATGSGDDTLDGSDGADSLDAGGGNDRLLGGEGNDTLDGGAGGDILQGGEGNDTYVVTAGDLVTEAPGAGTDTVQSGATYALTANVEKLVLTGSSAINGAGNALANTLTGNYAANVLNGAAGSDTLIGGCGDDIYVVTAGDVVNEAPGAGTDTVRSGASYVLTANVERLVLTGTTAINGTGNALGNTFSGNPGSNVLDGRGGADRLAGKGGNDTLVGGTGTDTLSGGDDADRFKFVTRGEGADSITDFASGTDKIQVVSANFGGVPVGTLLAGNFRLAGNTLPVAPVFVYDGAAGTLSFDADGSGAGAAVLLATLTGPKTLVRADIQVVAA
jgi:Ca2+-binding RTX toxin-like protein